MQKPLTSQPCPACGNTFTCDINAGKETCWCFELPPIIPIASIGENETAATCLCPDCLKNQITETLREA